MYFTTPTVSRTLASRSQHASLTDNCSTSAHFSLSSEWGLEDLYGRHQKCPFLNFMLAKWWATKISYREHNAINIYIYIVCVCIYIHIYIYKTAYTIHDTRTHVCTRIYTHTLCFCGKLLLRQEAGRALPLEEWQLLRIWHKLVKPTRSKILMNWLSLDFEPQYMPIVIAKEHTHKVRWELQGWP